MHAKYEIRNLTNNEIGTTVARNLDEACQNLGWQRRRITLVSNKVLTPEQAEKVETSKRSAGQ